MASRILAAGDTAASSSTITLADGESATLMMREARSANAIAGVEVEDSEGGWASVGRLTTGPAMVLQAVGTFRVTRAPGVYFAIDQG